MSEVIVLTTEREARRKKAEDDYRSLFGTCPPIFAYSTGDFDRDTAIINECTRLSMKMWLLPTDTFNFDRAVEAERTRLHMLVPA